MAPCPALQSYMIRKIRHSNGSAVRPTFLYDHNLVIVASRRGALEGAAGANGDVSIWAMCLRGRIRPSCSRVHPGS